MCTTYVIYKVVFLCLCASDDVLGAFSIAEPATEIIDHRLPATMTPTHVSPRESETAYLIVRRSVSRMCIMRASVYDRQS
jgi:hypothetical protein